MCVGLKCHYGEMDAMGIAAAAAVGHKYPYSRLLDDRIYQFANA